MSTEYRIRFENNEVIISTRHQCHPEQKPPSQNPPSSPSDDDEGISLGPSFHHTSVTGPVSSPPVPGTVRDTKGGGEVSPTGVGGGAPVPGGVTIVFGSVNYCCCGGSTRPGGGEPSSTDTKGIMEN
jgi:hypothetical protein